jgi:hypothetical protein
MSNNKTIQSISLESLETVTGGWFLGAEHSASASSSNSVGFRNQKLGFIGLTAAADYAHEAKVGLPESSAAVAASAKAGIGLGPLGEYGVRQSGAAAISSGFYAE